MVMDFHELKRCDFSLSSIKIIKQRPTYRTLSCPSRSVGGVLYILNGHCVYSFEGDSFSLQPGAVVYLPLGSCHLLEISSPEIEFYRVDFEVRIDGEYTRFSDRPLKMCDSAPYECLEALKELEEIFLRDDDSILKTEKLCKFLSGLDKVHDSASRVKLAPAVKRLHECRDDERIDCKALAVECFLSVSQFYNLFKETFGTSPLEYRAGIIVRRATAMLESNEMTVGEVSAALGFDNPSYFCRFFKKRTGASPLEYAKNKRK